MSVLLSLLALFGHFLILLLLLYPQNVESRQHGNKDTEKRYELTFSTPMSTVSSPSTLCSAFPMAGPDVRAVKALVGDGLLKAHRKPQFLPQVQVLSHGEALSSVSSTNHFAMVFLQYFDTQASHLQAPLHLQPCPSHCTA